MTDRHDIDDARLRMALRGLRRDAPPARDLWPDLAARLAQTPQHQPAATTRPRPWVPTLALAASLVLAIGMAWHLRPAAAPDESARLIQREAQAMTREYHAALYELERTAPPPAASPVTPALHELDRSAAQIRTALDRDPGARFLLDRLRSTYAQRLALTQRAALT